MSNRAPVVVMAAVCFLAAPSAFGEPGASVIVTDPEGDAETKDAEDYLDIVEAEVRDDGDAYTFILEVAGDLPDDPIASSDNSRLKRISWHWGVETDPSSDPEGYPLPGNNWLPYEYMVGAQLRSPSPHGSPQRLRLSGGDPAARVEAERVKSAGSGGRGTVRSNPRLGG